MTGVVTALDLGGSHVLAGSVDLPRGTVERGPRVSFPADADRSELLTLVVGAARERLGESTRVACAVPGPFDYAEGVGWIGHKLEPLYGVDLGAALATGLELPRHAITFVNDADAFLLGESLAGAAVGHARAVGVTLGTGLGSAFLADGRIVGDGATVPPNGEIHLVEYLAKPVEESISRAALIGRYGDPSRDVEELAALARAGDGRARTAFAEVGTALGEVLEPWLRSFAATCLVVGGSIARGWDLFEASLRSSLESVASLEAIRPAERLDDAALLGAAIASARIVIRHARATASQVAAWRHERLAAAARPLHELSVAEARAEQAAESIVRERASDGVVALDLDGGRVPLRLYRPAERQSSPLLVWLPGGGWVLDTLAASESTCRRLARETPCAVAAVRYRLAPEHPFPTALEDAVAAIRWLVAHAAHHALDPGRVVVGGASAGANLAAAVTQLARTGGDLALAAQVLVYPALARDPGTYSRHAYDDPAFFGVGDIEWCWSHYVPSEDATSPLASPLLAEELAGLPPALVVTAELDPLRDEGELYAERLRLAGVPVECVRFAGVPHGFFSRGGVLAAADDAQLLVIDTLRAAFAAPESAD